MAFEIPIVEFLMRKFLFLQGNNLSFLFREKYSFLVSITAQSMTNNTYMHNSITYIMDRPSIYTEIFTRSHSHLINGSTDI